MSPPLPGQSLAPAHAASGGLGEVLRRAREKRGLTVADCADLLRIRAPYLTALEQGQYDALPGLTYCVGFVKTYAEYLDLDGPAMVQRFKAEAAGLPLQPSLTLPSPAPVGRIPGGGPVLVAVIGLIAVVGAWVFLADDPRSLEIRIPELPERFAAMVQPRATPLTPATAPIPASPPDIAKAPVSSSAVVAAPAPFVPAPSVSAPSVSAPAAASPSPTSTPPTSPPLAPAAAPQALSSVQPALAPPTPSPAPMTTIAVTPSPVPAPATSQAEEGRTPAPQALGGAAPLQSATLEEPPRAPPTVAPPPAPSPGEGRVFGGQNTDARVVVKSQGESWVQVRDRDNSTVFTRLLSAGDIFMVPNRNGLTLWTGNAGVLEVTVDGGIAPSLGAPGAVKKNVSLDADRLKAGTAVGE